MTTIYAAVSICAIATLYVWIANTRFIRKSKTSDYCYYFRNGKRRTGRIVKKGFFKTLVHDVHDLKKHRILNTHIYPQITFDI